MRLDIVIAGVGGQGTVLASRVLAETAMEAGLPVRTSETIGMAQREGTVTSQVRIGEPLTGALIPDGSADILIGFELAETVRLLPKLKKGGIVLANTATIIPVSVAGGRSTYDVEVLTNFLKENVEKLTLFNATELAIQAGNYRAANTVFLGALSTLTELPFDAGKLLQTVLDTVPAKVKDTNNKAFQLGRKAMEV